MEKDTRSGNAPEGQTRRNLGELWRLMENARDTTEFTRLCEEAVRVGLVKAL